LHTLRPKQLRLPFPLRFCDIFESYPGQMPPLRSGEATIRGRQPKRFPPGWFAKSLTDPDWQSKHFTDWSAKRKAAGLPCVVTPAEVA
jgi:hypothetical protein